MTETQDTAKATTTGSDDAVISAVEAQIAANEPAVKAETLVQAKEEGQTAPAIAAPAVTTDAAPAAADGGPTTETPEAATVDAKLAEAVKRVTGMDYEALTAKLGDDAEHVANKAKAFRSGFDRVCGELGAEKQRVARLQAELEALRAGQPASGAAKDGAPADELTAEDWNLEPEPFMTKMNAVIEKRVAAVLAARTQADPQADPAVAQQAQNNDAEIDAVFTKLPANLFPEFGNETADKYGPNDPEMLARNDVVAEAVALRSAAQAGGRSMTWAQALNGALAARDKDKFTQMLAQTTGSDTAAKRRGGLVSPSSRKSVPAAPKSSTESAIDLVAGMLAQAG